MSSRPRTPADSGVARSPIQPHAGRFRPRLALRILGLTLVVSTLFTLLSSATQLYFDYHEDLADVELLLDQIGITRLETLTASQWVLDDELTLAQLQGILQMPDMAYAEVVPTGGETPVPDKTLRVGEPLPEGAGPSRAFPMIFQDRGQEIEVGTLHVAASLDGVLDHLKGRALMILATQGLETLSLSFFIRVRVPALLIRPLHTIGEYARTRDLENPAPSLTLDRHPSAEPDELDLVVGALREMHGRLIDDVAALHRAEREREEMISDLEAKNIELERFTFTVSHDLKAPLITVRGFLSLIEERLESSDKSSIHPLIRRVFSTTEKMSDLLEDLLELSRVGQVTAPYRDIDLGEAAREAAELLAGPISQRGVDLRIADDLPIVRGDRVRLVQVFQNLISNGIKFMGDQANPRIEVEALLGAENGIDGSAETAGCRVRDNGIGIAMRHQESVFNLFERLDAGVEGTGIGLALVHRVIQAHGGRVWVESKGRGRGSSFCFYLPFGETSPQARPSSAKSP